jgi:hypothetical protein
MHRRIIAVSSAATIVAALGLSGCGNSNDSTAASSSSSPVTTLSTTVAAPPQAAPLPPPQVLTDLLYKLADPAVPGTEKLGLVEGATPDEAAQLDKFARALQDGGFTPLTFEATDLAWSDTVSGNVVATVNVSTPNPAAGGFSFPMEFKPTRSLPAGWQLSRQTADMLLTLGDTQSSPTPTP